MSSAYGIARTYNQFIPPVNLELMAQALAVKQQRYDQGYSQVESTIDFMKNIDIVKPEDAQYFKERVDKLTNDLNSLEGVDFSSKGVTKAIKSYVGQAIDDNVINAITSTKKYRAFQSEVAKIQEKHPDKYSTVNEMYSLRPFMNYINDGKVGSQLSNLRYSPKVDVNEKMTKIVKEAFEKYGERTDFQISPDNWSKVISKVAGLEGEKIRRFVDANMSAEDRQQIAIDGWYNMGMAEGDQAKNILNEHVKKSVEEYQGQISILKNEQKNGVSKTRAKQLEAEIQNLEKAVEGYSELPKNLQSPEQIGAYFEREKLMGGLVSMYGTFQKSRELTTNDVYADKMKYFLDVSNLNLAKERLQFDREKDARDRADKLAAEQKNAELLTTPTVTNNSTEKDIYAEGINKIVEAEKQTSGEIDTAFESAVGDINEARGMTVAFNKIAEQGGKSVQEQKIAYLKTKAGDDEELREQYGRIEVNYLKNKDNYSKLYKNFETLVEENLTDSENSLKAVESKGYQPKEDKYINLVNFYKLQYEEAEGEEKKNYELLFNIAKDKYGNEEIAQIEQKLKQVAGKRDFESVSARNRYEDRLKYLREIQGSNITTLRKSNNFGNIQSTQAEISYNPFNTAMPFKPVVSNNVSIKEPVKERLRDISLSLAEEYGKKNIVLNAKNNPKEYAEARAFFSKSMVGDAFKDEEDIILMPTTEGKYKAYQKYINKEGEKDVTRQSIELTIDEIVKNNPNLASTIDFQRTVKPKFIETKQPLSWTYNNPQNVSFNRQAILKTIETTLKADQDFSNSLTDIIKNPNDYYMVAERSPNKNPKLSLYKGNNLVYPMLTQGLSEESIAGMQEEFVKRPEVFILNTVNEILSQYKTTKTKPTYFQ